MSDIATADSWTTDPWSSPSVDANPEPEPSATVEPEPAAPKTPRRRRPGTPRPAGGTRRGRCKEARVEPRRVVSRAFDVIALSGDEQRILAAAVGLDNADDLPEVVLASLARQEQATAACRLVVDVATAEPLAAGALAVGAAADGGLTGAWPVLACLSPYLGERPDRAVDAGMVFAAAAQQLDAGTLAHVEAVLAVLAG